jgi:hypothetical protein
MITPIEYNEIPEITFEGRNIKEYIATVKPIDKNKKIYYYVLMDNYIKFYLESTNHELTLETANEIYNNDREFYMSFNEVIDMEIETIECGTYIDDKMRAGWAYFHK